MANIFLDGDRGTNAFGTPNYYVHDVKGYQSFSEGTLHGYVGWLTEAIHYYHDQADINTYHLTVTLKFLYKVFLLKYGHLV